MSIYHIQQNITTGAKAMKKLLLIMFVLLLSAAVVYAANTVLISPGIIEITSIDSDWDGTASAIRIHSIVFEPGAANDVLAIEDGGASGPRIFPAYAVTDAEAKVMRYGCNKYKPYLDFSDCTLNAGATVTIYLCR